MDLYERIRERRIELGMTQEELAHILGYTSRSTVAKIEAGTNDIPQSKISDFAKALRTTPAYLMGIENTSTTPTSSIPGVLPIETKKIPLLGDIACGKPMFANQEYESYVEVGSDVRADFAVRATGTSMLPKIHDGDIVFVREQPIVDENEVAVVIIDDEVTLKRYRRVNEELVSLIPDNPEHNAIYVNLKEKQNVRILGKAIALQRDIL